MEKVTEKDFELFYRLNSMYNALTISTTSPVVIPSGISPPGKISAFSHVFYDAAENEDKALEIMRKRIKLNSGDIAKHLDLHKLMLKLFYDIEESANTSNRNSVSDAVSKLCTCVRDYTRLVAVHLHRPKEEAFLSYPTCIPGHYFVVPSFSIIRELSFNPNQNIHGVIREITDLEELLIDFEIQAEKISIVKVSDALDTGEGISDTSLRGRLELTIELLKRAGYN